MVFFQRKFLIGCATHAGIKHQDENQDSAGYYRPRLFGPRFPLCVIADGMGGYAGGSCASQTVVAEFFKIFKARRGDGDALSILKEATDRAHLVIKEKAQSDEALAAMGSTVVAGIFSKGLLALVNVGDSRAYRFHAGQMLQVSRDQSKVAELVASQAITKEEMRSHPQRNILTMSISGRRATVEPVLTTVPFEAGDRFLFCTDGLWSMVPDEEIQQIVENMPVQAAADNLILQANYHGGADNISAIIVEIR